MKLKSIGTIHSPFKKPSDTPIQPCMAEETEGMVVVNEEYIDALGDLESFDRIWLVYLFHRVGECRLKVKPFMEDVERGLFATRAPCRPNPLGISTVRLLSINENILRVAGIDVLDETPLLDVKPYVPRFDVYSEARAGWLDQGEVKKKKQVRGDGRFE